MVFKFFIVVHAKCHTRLLDRPVGSNLCSVGKCNLACQESEREEEEEEETPFRIRTQFRLAVRSPSSVFGLPPKPQTNASPTDTYYTYNICFTTLGMGNYVLVRRIVKPR